jgi:hypothetical protein
LCSVDVELFSQSEFLYNRTVTRDVFFLEVVEQFSSLTYQRDQSAFCVVVFFVLLQVLSQVADAEAEQGDLSFSRTCVLCSSGKAARCA